MSPRAVAWALIAIGSTAGCAPTVAKPDADARIECDRLLARISEAGSDRRVTAEETASIEDATAAMRASDGYVEGRTAEGIRQRCTRPPPLGDPEARP